MEWALSWPWLALALLGAYHGLNPGMGWLFAVARGLQQGSRGAVLGSLVYAGVSRGGAGGGRLHGAAAASFVDGLHRAVAVSGPRGFGMRVGGVGLAAWSFLMSSAHGAGLMLVPVLLGWPLVDGLPPADQWGTLVLVSTMVHVTAMLVVMAGAALIVYQVVGLRILRRGWFNLGLVWAVSLAAAGVITMFT